MRRESPIMFIDEMVRAIAAGTKDTTRRVCPAACQVPKDSKPYVLEQALSAAMRAAHSVGDLLWVRQSAICSTAYKRLLRGKNGQPIWPAFEPRRSGAFVDQHCCYTHVLNEKVVSNSIGHEEFVRMNKMFMPRWASRLELEVTDVRIERLSDMTDDEARREGFPEQVNASSLKAALGMEPGADKHLASFMATWDKIHKASRHEAFSDPLLFVYRFKVHKYTRDIKRGDEWINCHYRYLMERA